MKRESPTRGRMEMDELWWVKKEIREEMAKDMMSTNSESDILTQGVMMKEMQKISETEGPRCPSAVKKELADGVKVARDMSELGDSAKSECQEDLGRERQANS